MSDQDSSFTVEQIKGRLSTSTLVFHGYRHIFLEAYHSERGLESWP